MFKLLMKLGLFYTCIFLLELVLYTITLIIYLFLIKHVQCYFIFVNFVQNTDVFYHSDSLQGKQCTLTNL